MYTSYMFFIDTFSVFCQLCTYCEMNKINSLYRLVENDIIIKDLSDNIQQMAGRGNHEITYLYS